jgi:hypothetical protein
MQPRGFRAGQLLSTEIILALSLFLVAMLVFVLAWNYISFSYSSEQADRQMQSSLIGVSDSLVLSPGSPADWEYSSGANASSFGLASSRNVLSAAKLSALQSLNATDYDNVRERMGAGKFDLYVEASNPGGPVLYNFGHPADLSSSSVSAVVSQRLATLGGSVVVLKVELWRAKGRLV